MQQKPQRPFVPHRTPKSAAGISGRSEFRLSRAFVPDTESGQLGVAMSAASTGPTAIEFDRDPVLPGIDEFVHTSSEVVELTAIDARESYAPLPEEDEFELPPIEHFTDPLPVVEAFAPDSEGALIDGSADGMDYTSGGTAPPVQASTGWVDEDWQRFDWSAAAALGDAPDAQATNDWATTDWDAAAQSPRERKPSAANAIASALDHIARQIRDGELALPSPNDLGDPMAIAAKLAAMLGGRS